MESLVSLLLQMKSLELRPVVVSSNSSKYPPHYPDLKLMRRKEAVRERIQLEPDVALVKLSMNHELLLWIKHYHYYRVPSRITSLLPYTLKYRREVFKVEKKVQH